MTDEQLIDLGRRAVACKGWRWMPGMLALDSTDEEHPGRVIDDRKSLVYEDADGAIREGVVARSDLPDLTDPATLGCLLELVREAWVDLGASVWHDRRTGIWSWMAVGCMHSVWMPSDEDGYPTEAAALVAALEACNGA
jgi:hypothetical protein